MFRKCFITRRAKKWVPHENNFGIWEDEAFEVFFSDDSVGIMNQVLILLCFLSTPQMDLATLEIILYL